MIRTRSLVPAALASLLVGPAWGQSSQELAPRWRPTKSESFSLSQLGRSDVVVLKLADDLDSLLIEGQLFGPDALEPVRARLGAEPGLALVRMASLEPSVLDELRARAQARSGQELADLAEFYALRSDGSVDLAALVRDLLALEVVENAYVAAPPAPAPVMALQPVRTPDLESDQGYRSAAPVGLDANYARASGMAGALGEGVTVVDLEYAWNVPIAAANWTSNGHEDLVGHQVPTPIVDGRSFVGDPSTWWDFSETGSNWSSNQDHGTAVLGVLSGDDNGFGVTGIAPESEQRVIATCIADGQGDCFYALLDGLVLSALSLEPGDVVLIEQQTAGPNHGDAGALCGAQFGLIASEYWDAEFHAVKQLTALGVHVVAAAGNGTQDFDNGFLGGSACDEGDPSYLERFDITQRDSGSILVGAASEHADHGWLLFSNWGRRIDACAWGQNVTSAGYGDASGLTADEAYTYAFSGTSSASAQVAGAVAVIEAAHRAAWNQSIPPLRLRTLLRGQGSTASWSHGLVGTIRDEDRIGRQPDLKDALETVAQGPFPALAVSGGHQFDDPNAIGANFRQTYFGDAMASIGDVDGDGVGDLVVGSPLSDCAFVYSARTGYELSFSTGTWINTDYGIALAHVGDVNGDGVAEYAVGAPQASGRGSIEVIDPRFTDHEESSHFGSTNSDFGHAVAGPGDLDGDGVPDVIGGAPYASTARGSVTAFRASDGTSLWARSGVNSNDHMGWDVAGAGDVDLDGFPDVAVSSLSSDFGALNGGLVQILRGTTGAELTRIEGVSDGQGLGRSLDAGQDFTYDGVPDLVIGCSDGSLVLASGAPGSGGAPSATLPGEGGSVAILADANGDDFPDFAVGASSAQTVKLWSGKTLSVARTYTGGQSGDGFGTAVASAGDLDGDGRTDLYIGAPDHGSSFLLSGRVWAHLSGDVPSTPPSVAPPAIVAHPPSIEANLPTQFGYAQTRIELQAPSEAGKLYWLLANWTGTSPGVDVSGIHIPLNVPDPVFTASINLGQLNQPPFTGFQGTLDAQGRATATFGPYAAIDDLNPPAGMIQFEPSMVGAEYNFCFITFPLGFVSPTTTVTLVQEYP